MHPTSAVLLDTIRHCLDPAAQLDTISELELPGRGYSGAALRRYRLTYRGGDGSPRTTELVLKDALPVERQSLALLYQQSQALIPFNYAPDLCSAGPAALGLEMIEGDTAPVTGAVLERAAQGLAALHLYNRGKAQSLAWLPPANRAYFESGYVLGTWRAAWAQALSDPAFAGEYGPFSPRLETAAQHFLSVMEAWWDEGDALTLIHCDLHRGNLLVRGGQPYLVDWEQARCGAFYLDLPNLFDRRSVLAYQRALQQGGYPIAENTFFARYAEAGRYVGFKYLGFTLQQWADRDQPASRVREYLNNLIGLALDGA